MCCISYCCAIYPTLPYLHSTVPNIALYLLLWCITKLPRISFCLIFCSAVSPTELYFLLLHIPFCCISYSVFLLAASRIFAIVGLIQSKPKQFATLCCVSFRLSSLVFQYTSPNTKRIILPHCVLYLARYLPVFSILRLIQSKPKQFTTLCCVSFRLSPCVCISPDTKQRIFSHCVLYIVNTCSYFNIVDLIQSKSAFVSPSLCCS